MNEQSPPLYRIRDWDKHFENYLSKKYKHIGWIPVPNKHDGEAYNLLAERDDFPQVFAAWILLLQVASKCSPRGILVKDDGSPHTPRSLSLKTRLPTTIFESALKTLVEVAKWVIVEDASTIVEDASTNIALNGTEQNRKEKKRKEPPAAEDAPPFSASPPEPEPPADPIAAGASRLERLFRERTKLRGMHKTVYEMFYNGLLGSAASYEVLQAAVLKLQPGEFVVKPWDFIDQFKQPKAKPWAKADTHGSATSLAATAKLLEQSRRSEAEAKALTPEQKAEQREKLRARGLLKRV